MKTCNICGIELNQDNNPTTRDCGGDCLKCMAIIAEDPDCQEELAKIVGSNEVYNG